MSSPTTFLPRRVIPRWRDFNVAARTGELDTLSPDKRADNEHEKHEGIEHEEHEVIKAKWSISPSIPLAGELLSSSVILGDREEGTKAARYILDNSGAIMSPATEMAHSFLEMEPVGILSGLVEISSLRAALRSNARNPIAWSNLARIHAILGDNKKALREMTIAFELARDSRYMLRVATRCFLHLEDPARAGAILLSNARWQEDPWIAAALVSTQSILGQTPRKIRGLRSLAADGNLELHHRAELLAAIATLEIESGNDGKAKRLLREALHDPNENVVAQGLWVMRNHFQINIDDNQLDTPYSFEANTMAASRVGNWEVAREKAKLWYKDEPFAGRPAVELGFLQAVIFQDYQESVSVLTPALKANEGDLKIINNLAYSLACMGKINEAKEIYSRVNLKQVSDTQRIHLVATAGLIEFRDGNHIEGRKFYEKAASFAGTIRGGELKALVKGYHALEEDRMFAEGASEIKKEATELLSKFKGAVPQWLKGRLEADIDTTGGVLGRAIAKGKP